MKCRRVGVMKMNETKALFSDRKLIPVFFFQFLISFLNFVFYRNRLRIDKDCSSAENHRNRKLFSKFKML